MKTFLKVYGILLFAALGRTMFHIAYLGASAERELHPGKEETPYFLAMLLYMACIIWTIVITRKKDLPFPFLQGLVLISLSSALTFYLYLLNS